jgi:phosphopantothenoylcysteine decarboxylase / phosphopantothenate---cysteine ligase
MIFHEKKILLAVSGSIAAYKAVFLTRLLVKAGAQVQVILTKGATDFVTPLTFSTLSKRPVFSEVSSATGWNNHVELGLWADAMIVAPATANTLAKMAHGLCDNMLTACYLSAKCPVFFAPAMDLDMWKHPSTLENIRLLKTYGNHLIPVGNGELASGLSGEGRMAEPEDIVALLESFFARNSDLSGKKVMITAGPTYEPLDPVRFIGNHSSGKMGIALAEAAAERGAMVELLLGPSKYSTNHPNIKTTRIQTAQQLYEAAMQHFSTSYLTILAAAVADYRPKIVSDTKIKKKEATFTLVLEKTIDIAASLGKLKTEHQIMVGFALETNNELENAQKKLLSKNLDCIVLNSMRDAGATFNHDTNKITMVFKDNSIQDFPLKPKTAVADDILDVVIEKFIARNK